MKKVARRSRPGSAPTAWATSHDVDLVPFYREHRRLYMGYFDVYTPADWARSRHGGGGRDASASGSSRRRRSAYVQPGEMQPEARLQSARGEHDGRRASTSAPAGPAAAGSRSTCRSMRAQPERAGHDLPFSDSRRPRTFDILVDGQPLAQEQFDTGERGEDPAGSRRTRKPATQCVSPSRIRTRCSRGTRCGATCAVWLARPKPVDGQAGGAMSRTSGG